jgi:hypothetical protein
MTLAMPDAVGHAGELVTPMLQEMVDQLDSGSRLLGSCHFGWCGEQGRPANANGGKMIGPMLALLGAEACGVRNTNRLRPPWGAWCANLRPPARSRR